MNSTKAVKARGGTALFAAFLALLLAACEQPAGKILSPDASLKSLGIEGADLEPPFSAEIASYTVNVPYDCATVSVEALPASPAARVSTSGGQALTVNEASAVTVTVTAEDGTVKTWTITVTRLPDTRIEIRSAEDLAKIGVEGAFSLSGDYVLKADITLENWVPLGNDKQKFRGSFDGGGHTITLKSFSAEALDSGIYRGAWGNSQTTGNFNAGIFALAEGTTKKTVRIRNLTIDSRVNAASHFARHQQNVGLLAGTAIRTEIENVTLKGGFAFTSEKIIKLGGLVGELGTDALIKNCRSTMGLAVHPGLAMGGAYSYVGGVAGKFGGGGILDGVHVTADVEATSEAGGSQIFVGGITGGSDNNMSHFYRGIVRDSSFTGTVTGKAQGAWTFCGGIVGVVAGEGSKIERCSVKGTVTVAETGSNWPYVGGIAGYNYYGSLISRCRFSGEVRNTNHGSDYTGGIAGYNSQEPGHGSRVEDCYSEGTVQGWANAGGIVGQNQIGTFIRRCYTTMAVSTLQQVEGSGPSGEIPNGEKDSAQPGTGGIAGVNASSETDAISGCFALNSSITTAGPAGKLHRVSGSNHSPESMSRNSARAALVLTGSGYQAEKGATKVDGADCAEKPAQADYVAAGWDFPGVWTMDANGFPRLSWEN